MLHGKVSKLERSCSRELLDELSVSNGCFLVFDNMPKATIKSFDYNSTTEYSRLSSLCVQSDVTYLNFSLSCWPHVQSIISNALLIKAHDPARTVQPNPNPRRSNM